MTSSTTTTMPMRALRSLRLLPARLLARLLTAMVAVAIAMAIPGATPGKLSAQSQPSLPTTDISKDTGKGQPPAVAGFVPPDTIVFLHLPDITATLNGFQGSNLRKIFLSPEGQAVAGSVWASVEKLATDPLVFSDIEQKDPAAVEKKKREFFNEKVNAAMQIMIPALPLLDGEAFIAWSGLNAPGAPMRLSGRVILGLRPKNGPAAFTSYAAFITGKLKEAGQDLSRVTGTDTVEGVTYSYLALPVVAIVPKDNVPADPANKDRRLCFAIYKDWVLIAVGERGLADFIQRATGTGDGGLAKAPDVVQTWQKLYAAPDSQGFVAVQPLLKNLDALVTDPQIRETLRRMWTRDMGISAFSARFNGALIEDRYATTLTSGGTGAPGSTGAGTNMTRNQYDKPCAFTTMRYTSPATVGYLARCIDFARTLRDIEADKDDTLGMAEPLKRFRSGLSQIGIKVESLAEAMGDEFAVVVDSDGTAIPEAAFIVPLVKPENFAPLAEFATKYLGVNGLEDDALTFKLGTIDKYTVVEVSYPRSPMIPTTVVTLAGGPVFGIFSSRKTAERHLTKPAAATTVMDQPEFKTALPGGAAELKGAAALTYVNTPAVTAQAFPLMRMMYGIYIAPNLAGSAPALARLTLPDTLIVPQLTTGWAATVRLEDNALVVHSLSGIGNPVSSAMGTALIS
ncbi:MAG: hypothetical protein ACAI35_17040, partial [Candidatus Methylacidiphilales bacterium]